MVEIIKTTEPGLVAVRVSGTLHKSDYQQLVPLLEQKIAAHGKINLLWHMRDFTGWTLHGLLKDLAFDVRHINDFRKIALVGDKTWEQALTHLMKPFTPAQVKFFPVEQQTEAMEWLRT